MKTRFVVMLAIALFCGHARAEPAQNVDPVASDQDAAVVPLTVNADPNDPIEEITVEGQRLKPEFDLVTMGRIRDDNGNGARLYRQGKYKEAFPLLLSAAQNGFKLAQARLSFIYQLGLGEVPRDAEAAIGWLGVAASPVTNNEVTNYYKKFVANIPEEHMVLVNEIVDEYIEKYGSDAIGMHCSKARMAGTHISRLKCDFDEEYDYRNGLDDEDIMESVLATGSFTMEN
jgi:hypothetical protein